MAAGFGSYFTGELGRAADAAGSAPGAPGAAMRGIGGGGGAFKEMISPPRASRSSATSDGGAAGTRPGRKVCQRCPTAADPAKGKTAEKTVTSLDTLNKTMGELIRALDPKGKAVRDMGARYVDARGSSRGEN